LCLSQNSDASACLIIIFIVQLFLCLSYSCYSSIWCWCTLTKVLGYACQGNCICLIPYLMVLWFYPLWISGI
jgi:hypothetical protein